MEQIKLGKHLDTTSANKHRKKSNDSVRKFIMSRSYFLYVILFCCSFWVDSHAQAFQKMTIRDIAKMKNNYGNAVADYDQDGDLDIFIVAYDAFIAQEAETWSRLLENRGSGWFEDSTIESGLSSQFFNGSSKANKLGVAWGDYDNDGFPDLLLTHAGGVQLFHNQQDGTFEEVTMSAGIEPCSTCVNTSGMWWDYDNDGLLDFYISDYREMNRLYRNTGNGVFEELSDVLNLADSGSTWCSIAFDFNRDGWQDIYVINDYGFSRMYLNQQGGNFVESTIEYGLRNTGSAMGVSIGDYNNDGYFDIYVTNISEFQPNPLFTGSESGVFTNTYEAQNVGEGNWAWGTHFFDADHDGDEDLYIVNGFGGFTYNNKFYKNNWVEGKTEFTEMSERASCNGDAHGMGLEVFDYDDDGDLDLLVSNTNSHPYIYQNTGRASHTNWLQVELEGTNCNRNAFGAVLIANGNGRSLSRYHHGVGIMSQSIKPVHFGLGDMKVIDTLTVIWPGNHTEHFYNIEANQKIRIKESPQTLTSVSTLSLNNPIAITRVIPNPFHESVTIGLQVSQSGILNARIYSSTGQLIWQEKEREIGAGQHQIKWNGEQTLQNTLPCGFYFYQIEFDNQSITGKIIKQ